MKGLTSQVPHLALSTNLVMLAIMVGVVLYGLLAGHAKVRNLALSTYVGIVLASQLGPGLQHWLAHGGHGINLGIARLILFAAPIALLEFSRRHHAKGGHGGMIIAIILSVLSAGMIIAMGMAQLEPDTIKHITDSSIIAFELYNWRLWLVALVPVLIIAEAFIGQGKSEKH